MVAECRRLRQPARAGTHVQVQYRPDPQPGAFNQTGQNRRARGTIDGKVNSLLGLMTLATSGSLRRISTGSDSCKVATFHNPVANFKVDYLRLDNDVTKKYLAARLIRAFYLKFISLMLFLLHVLASIARLP
jgi:hypothetical protein